MSFRPGQHVVCVKTPKTTLDGVIVPQRGIVYTVREVHPIGDKDVVLLCELDNSHLIGSLAFCRLLNRNVTIIAEGGWGSDHFRPLDESRLDQFRAHLAPAPKPPVAA